MSATITLALQDLTIRYAAQTAVDALTLNVHSGEIYGLLGPNGCGKSSTLGAIAGVVQSTSGSIHVQCLAHQQCRTEYLSRVGVVPQELALYEELTVRENLTFFGQLYQLPRAELRHRCAEALAFVHLSDHANQRVGTLSGGMQRRVNLACALLHRPALLLLDEPTVGLDIASRNLIFDNLRELREQGCALVFTTHHLEEAELLCDRIGVMQQGRLLAEGTLEQLKAGLQMQTSRLKLTSPQRLEEVYLELTKAA